MQETLRDGARELLVACLWPLPPSWRKATERWLRGRDEYRRLGKADAVVVSWGKSGRTWLRLMLSRFYQVRHGLPETAFLEFDNLKRARPEIPALFFTHGNYLRDYTSEWDTRDAFRGRRTVLLLRDPRDVAVSQFFQWRYRMRPHKKWLNDYPVDGMEMSVFDFVRHHPAGLARVIGFMNAWSASLPRLGPLHVVRYEDLRAQPEKELARILDFLGTPGEPDEIADSVAFASVDHMRELETRNVFWLRGRRMRAGDRGNPESFKVRRAKVGGYRDYFTPDELESIDAYVAEHLTDFYH